jgi:GNAT superfamily N-acetyltransferase
MLIRTGDRPGDLGTVAAMHGVLYAREKGMDQTIEAYVAAALGAFVTARSREGDKAGGLWVAELDDTVVGSIGITRSGESEAQLRWFLVDPGRRGSGVGRGLLETALDYCRRNHFRSVFLWTIAGLDRAHELYRREGFTHTEDKPGHQWGIDVVEQRFDLALTR